MGRFGGPERGPAKRSDEETHSRGSASWLRQSGASSAGLSNRPTSGRASGQKGIGFWDGYSGNATTKPEAYSLPKMYLLQADSLA